MREVPPFVKSGHIYQRCSASLIKLVIKQITYREGKLKDPDDQTESTLKIEIDSLRCKVTSRIQIKDQQQKLEVFKTDLNVIERLRINTEGLKDSITSMQAPDREQTMSSSSLEDQIASSVIQSIVGLIDKKFGLNNSEFEEQQERIKTFLKDQTDSLKSAANERVADYQKKRQNQQEIKADAPLNQDEINTLMSDVISAISKTKIKELEEMINDLQELVAILEEQINSLWCDLQSIGATGSFSMATTGVATAAGAAAGLGAGDGAGAAVISVTHGGPRYIS